MNDTQVVTYLTVAALIGFGIYRKNYTPDDTFDSTYKDEPYVLSDPARSSRTAIRDKPGAEKIGRVRVAQIARKIEELIGPNESIIQVHDYTNEDSGMIHIFDVTTFNSANTQTLNKRIECIEKGNAIEILSTELISPITGSVVTPKNIMDDVSDLLLDDLEVDGDAKFVRDKYAFVQKDVLPPEPDALSRECTRQVNQGEMTDHCRTQLKVYTRAMDEYKRQVDESKTKRTFTKRRLGFAPTDESIGDHQKYPFSHPQTFGFSAHEETPIDYSSLSELKPLEDEKFFNSIAMEKSVLAIQYG